METDAEAEKIIKTEEVLEKREAKKIVLMSKFSPVPYAESLQKEYTFLYDKYKRFWRYDPKNGIWREDAEDFIKSNLRNELLGEEQQRNQYTTEVVSYIRDISWTDENTTELDINFIPFQNCIYDIEKDEFVDFSPKYFVTNKIPVKIDSNITDCDVIDGFFEDCVGKELKSILYDLCAYCLFRYQPYQKMFFLFGAGANGKSTFLELLREFVGVDNVSSVSPHELINNRFSIGGMWNKYANVSSDISYDVLRNVNKLKEITGGDTVYVERKYQDPFPAKVYAKQIFSTNQLPIVNDKTLAWYRRIYLIQFPRIIEEKMLDPMLLQKLTTENQLNGLAWQCIKRLREMKKRNYRFEKDIDIEKMKEMYEDLSNPLHKFLRENVDDGYDDHLWKFEFKDRFQDWLKQHKFRTWSESEIGVEMKRMRHEDSKKTFNEFGKEKKRYWAWLGIKWKSLSDVKAVTSVTPFSINSIYKEVVSKPLDIADSLDQRGDK